MCVCVCVGGGGGGMMSTLRMFSTLEGYYQYIKRILLIFRGMFGRVEGYHDS